AEWDGDIARYEPADVGAEEERADAFQPAQIELPPAVNAFHERCQPAVQAEQGITTPEGVRIRQIGDLELVARQRVAQIRKAEEPVLRDPVEQLLDHLVEGHLL